MPDKKQLVALGIGNNGAYWECNFTEVKVNQIKGFMVFRDHEGQTLQGDYMIKRISDVLLESQFKTKDPKDGQLKSWKGNFKKVVKKKWNIQISKRDKKKIPSSKHGGFGASYSK